MSAPHMEAKARAPIQVAASDVAAFILEEARLLDSRMYAEWLDLFSANTLYWMPVNPDSANGDEDLCHIYDDKAKMLDRVGRVGAGAHTEDPPGRTSRILGFPLLLGTDPSGALEVFTPFQLVMSRRNQQHLFAGNYQHRLERVGDGWSILEKRVCLIEAEDALPAMTILF